MGLRKGPPSAVSLIVFGYHHCQWRIQAYGIERFAGFGRGADGNLRRGKIEPIAEQAIACTRRAHPSDKSQKPLL
ncbi:MAG: hypothetical protein GY880_31265 [Planctomycetaceae bacterium]|nr:hypothetical protein [Planctomycetaceae bacterium]